MINIQYIPLPQNGVAYKKTSYAMQPEFVVIHNTANDAPAIKQVRQGFSYLWLEEKSSIKPMRYCFLLVSMI